MRIRVEGGLRLGSPMFVWSCGSLSEATAPELRLQYSAVHDHGHERNASNDSQSSSSFNLRFRQEESLHNATL